jgi:serine/alanine adding enzyme
MAIRLYNEKDSDRWGSYVNHSDGSTCYHHIGWKDVIEKTFGHKTHYLIAENQNGEMTGLLPLVHLKSLLFGSFMVSLPYFNYGGICADNEEIGDELLGEAVRIAQHEKANHIELRHSRPMTNGMPVKTGKVSMILDLPEDSENLWKGFSSNLRRKIRKPAKEGMEARIGREEELDNFYAVFSINMRDLGTPVYSKDFFRNILTVFPDNTWICTVYNREAKPVASLFMVDFKENIEMPWVSSIRSFNKFYPNFLLYWTALKFGCEKGYKAFDFGRSTPGEGTYRFKEQWGAKPRQLYWHYWLRDGGPLPEINPHNPKYQLAIKLWSKLPVGVTRVFGPGIVRNLP